MHSILLWIISRPGQSKDTGRIKWCQWKTVTSLDSLSGQQKFPDKKNLFDVNLSFPSIRRAIEGSIISQSLCSSDAVDKFLSAVHYVWYGHPSKQPRPDSWEVYSVQIWNRESSHCNRGNSASMGIDDIGIMSKTEEILVPVILRISWRPVKKFGLVEDSYFNLFELSEFQVTEGSILQRRARNSLNKEI